MEVEQNGKLAFLDVLVCEKPNNIPGHEVYRKQTCTNRYHNTYQKQSVVHSLTYRTINISYQKTYQ